MPEPGSGIAKLTRESVISNVAEATANADWLEMIEAMLPLIALLKDNSDIFATQLGTVLHSFAGQLRQFSIETFALSEACRHVIGSSEIENLLDMLLGVTEIEKIFSL